MIQLIMARFAINLGIEKVSKFIELREYIKVNGLMISDKVTDIKNFKIIIFTKELTKLVNLKEEECIHGIPAKFILGNGRMG